MAVRELGDKRPDGNRLGQAAADLVSFYGADPVAQASVITNTSGTLGDANTAIDAINTVLQNLGLTASS